MFERRLKVLLILMVLPTLVLVARLAHLQIVEASAYRERADAMLLRPPRFYPCLRGPILDRYGQRLAYDAESWDLCVHYGVLARDEDYRYALIRDRLRARGEPRTESNLRAEMKQLETDVRASWDIIRAITGEDPELLAARVAYITERVERIKARVSELRNIETIVAEERMAHPVVRDLNQDQQVEARVRLADYPWVEVVPAHARRYLGGESVGHFLGLLQEVQPRHLEQDPYINDELARYQAGDQVGFCGVEGIAEDRVRGRRGRIHEDIEGRTLSSVEPEHGKPFRLTIDLELQQQLYKRLSSAVKRYTYSTGGSAVVLDLPSREILAMVSYPSFDPNTPYGERLELDEDRLRLPLACRAIGHGKTYPPGSTVKPMVLAAALTDGAIGHHAEIECRGHLLPGVPGKWRCFSEWGHGPVDPVFSIQQSCNVFYYTIGQQMGVTRQWWWMKQFGFGRTAGTGLWEENPGNLPRDGGRGDARNMAIGQWTVEVTPLQVANMSATIATGAYRPVKLWLDDPEPRPATRLPIPEGNWQPVRQGMYKVVNEPRGTAFPEAKLTDSTPCVLLGKTGSAEPPPQESLYTCVFPDGRRETIKARNYAELRDRYPAGAKPIELLGQQPAAEYPTHGWFTGYTAPRERPTAPIGSGDSGLAIAVVLEYAGHGGDVAAPVARDMVELALARRDPGRMASASEAPR